MKLTPLSLPRARSDATASLRTAEHFARVGKPLLQAAHIDSASWSLQRAIPSLPASEVVCLGREILANRMKALGLYLSNGGLLDAARELSHKAFLYEQLRAWAVDLRTPADLASQVPATDLLRSALQDRLESIEMIRRLPPPQTELASLLSYTAKTIHLLLESGPRSDAAELVEMAIPLRVEAADLFEKMGKSQDVYFENKFLSFLYLRSAGLAAERGMAGMTPELCLKASLAAEKAVDLAREKHISDKTIGSLYNAAAVACRRLSRQARDLVPPDVERSAFYRRKYDYYVELKLGFQRAAARD